MRRLRISRIVDWARSFRRRTGDWPDVHSGPIPESPGDTWITIDQALRFGARGLPKTASLADLLSGYRFSPIGTGNRRPRQLTDDLILAWAREHERRTGRLPHQHAGIIPNTDGLTWMSINEALRRGLRGLPGGSSISRLLGKKPGSARNVYSRPLTTELILEWADAHHARTGEWPTPDSGRIPEAPENTWQAVMTALHGGYRGLKGGTTLRKFLARHRGVPLREARHAPLTHSQILAWADDHHARHGVWPNRKSGSIHGTENETWESVSNALNTGSRGLKPGSLAKLLAAERGVRNSSGLPPITHQQILRWAEEHHARTGQWPRPKSGEIPDSGGETWSRVQNALFTGSRGLSDRKTLQQFLCKHRGISYRRAGASSPRPDSNSPRTYSPNLVK